MSTTYTVIDFETTGLTPENNQVIELAAIKLDSNLKQIGSLHMMLKLEEGRELSDFITNLTGITEEDLKDGYDADFAIWTLEDFIADSIVVAQYASFDLSYYHKYEGYTPDFICTRSMSQLLRPTERASLKDLIEYYDVPLDNPHRALADATATAEVFKRMKAELDAKGIEYLNVMTEREDRKLNFIPKNAKVVEIKSA